MVLKPLTTLTNSFCRFVLRCNYFTHHCIMYDTLNWLQPKERRKLHWLIFVFKCVKYDFPLYLIQHMIPFVAPYALRNLNSPYFRVPQFKKAGTKAFCYKAPSDWNNLPTELRSITSLRIFKTSVFKLLKSQCQCY